MKPQFALTIHNCAKTYNNHEFVFSPCSAELHNGEIIGITGWNGSGKSTLIKMVAGLLKPSNGSIHLKINNETYHYGEFTEHIGLVSPYLQVYEEFTPIEHAKIYCDLSGIPFNLNLLEYFTNHSNFKSDISKFIFFFDIYKKEIRSEEFLIFIILYFYNNTCTINLVYNN